MTPKFRAWDFVNNRMLRPEQILSMSANGDWINAPGGMLNNVESMYHPQTEFALMLCLGFMPNGKEVYAGDILKNEYGEVVVFEWKQETKQEVWGHGESGFNIFAGYHFSGHGKTYEVIGNIYENPELKPKR